MSNFRSARRLLVSVLLVLGAAASARADSEEETRVKLIRKASKSVARILVVWAGTVKDNGKDVPTTDSGSGTGFVIVENGKSYIVTNHHVVNTPADVKARIVAGFNDGLPTIDLELVGADAATDIAVLRAKSLTPDSWKSLALAFAQPEGLEVGQSVLAVGYPRRLTGGPSVSRGMIGALDRVLGGFSDLIQTDAGINPGNSGGPLINLRGEVVGVNTYNFAPKYEIVTIPVPQIRQDGDKIKVEKPIAYAALKSVDATVGMNYARSCRSALPIVRQLIKAGKIQRPDLGFTFKTLSWDDATVYHLPEGVLVSSVRKDGPAAKAQVSTPNGLPDSLYNLALWQTSICVLTEVRWEHENGKGKVAVKSGGDMQIALAQIPLGSKVALKVVMPSPERIAVLENAMAKGWMGKGMADAETHEMVVDWLKLGTKAIDKELVIGYTLPTK